MFRLQWVFFIALMALVGVSTGTAGAQTLYGVTYSPPQLITINTATGAGTLVGNLNPAIIADGIAFRGAKLYVMDGTSQNIYEINPATGATLATINIGAPPGSFGEGGMAFRSDGIGFLIGFSPTPLIRFDITVPSSTVIAPVVPAFILDEMAFNASDVLYGISQSTGLPFNDVSTQLYTINQATGAMTLVGPSGINNQAAAGLSFDASGNLFLASADQGTSVSKLYKINPATGAATLIGTIAGFLNVSGLAFQGGPGVPIAKPSNGEGTYAGSSGPSGGEGSFGFGGGISLKPAPKSAPILKAPFLDASSGTYRVLNVACQQDPPAASQPNGWDGSGSTPLLMLAGALAIGVVVARKAGYLGITK